MRIMKRLLLFLFVVFFTVGMMVTATYAEDISSSPGMEDGYLTWQFLGTMVGAVTATTLLVQFLKLPLDRIWKIPTRFLVYVIAFLILLAVELFYGTLSPARLILTILNAVIVATSAWGTYEAARKKIVSVKKI